MIRNLLKGVDNATYDVQRIMAVLSNAAGIVYAGCHLAFNGQFSIVEFGIGMGSLNALIGGGIALKDLGVAKAKTTMSAVDSSAEPV